MPLEMSEVHFGNTVVPYRILRSTRRRTVSIAIDPTDGVVVTAPAAATIAKLDDIVHRKAGWVLERLRRRSSSPPPPLARSTSAVRRSSTSGGTTG